MSSPSIGRFHVLTDFTLQQRFSHAELAEQAVKGGADLIQFREKRAGIQHQLQAAHEIVECCHSLDTKVIIDDRLDICLATGADGVHLGQRDFPVEPARDILGADAVIGATATNVRQAIEAENNGASYIGFGPVFESDTKRRPESVKGLARLRAVVNSVDLPVIAISGITPDRVAAVMRSGAHGIAVLSGIATARDPRRAAADYREALDEALQQT